jgi:acyl-CoA hydrolase
MTLSFEQLDLVEEYAGLFLTPAEIAVLIEVDRVPFCAAIAAETAPMFDRYLLGKTNKKKEIREKVVLLATKNSPAAQELTEKYMKDQELDERNNARK